MSLRLLEVGPRDGLQNEKLSLTLDQREKIIHRLLEIGIEDIEAGSIVRANAIPQLKGTDQLLKKIVPWKKKNYPKSRLWVFAPNAYALDRSIECEVDGASFFCATSESFTKRNINRSFTDVKKMLSVLIPRAHQSKVLARVYLSTLVFCPFEGTVPAKKVFSWIDFLRGLGVKDVALSDTTGHAHPKTLEAIFKWVNKHDDPKYYSLHFHDTRGTALLNTHVAYDAGFRRFDSSIGGTGGCPYAPGASGNLATEDLVYYMQQSRGDLTKLSLEKLARLSLSIEEYLDHKLPSRVLQSLRSKI